MTAAVLVTAAVVRTVPEPRVAAELARLREYCGTVRVAVATDAHDLESSDPKLRVEAADRFYSLYTFHSLQEIELCSPTPPDLSARDACWLRGDFGCLARLARLAETSIPIWVGSGY